MFMTDDFLLNSRWSRALYHEVAKDLPIIDYHAHLPPADIAGRHKFANLAELWLGTGTYGDHYKWRLMRAAGVPERLITGDAPARDKCMAFCSILPKCAGSPVLQWSHLELKRLFGLNYVINAENGPRIWDAVNEQLAGMDTWSFLRQANVEIASTTDDPADDLAAHEVLAKSELKTRVLPAYRPDKAMHIEAAGFPAYLEKLGKAAGVSIDSFASLVKALAARVDYFHAHGARVSDHAWDLSLPTELPDDASLEKLFARRMAGAALSTAECAAYVAGLLLHLGRVYARKEWTMCFHIGALRSVSTRGLKAVGPDAGFDSLSEIAVSESLCKLLDGLDRDDLLPRTMLFCLNPGMNEALAAAMGCFQDGKIAGKLQFGPAWWFCDHKDGNLEQLRTLGNYGVLGTFVGMVTDSRSFASFPRHDYFRRLVCRLLGEWVEAGEYPADFDALATIVRGISYENAKKYFRF